MPVRGGRGGGGPRQVSTLPTGNNIGINRLYLRTTDNTLWRGVENAGVRSLEPIDSNFRFGTPPVIVADDTARDTYFTNNAGELTQYDNDPDLFISVGTGFQRRVSSAWVSAGVIVKGEKGDEPTDARLDALIQPIVDTVVAAGDYQNQTQVNALIQAAITAGDFKSEAEINALITTALTNGDYQSEAEVQALIMAALTTGNYRTEAEINALITAALTNGTYQTLAQINAIITTTLNTHNYQSESAVNALIAAALAAGPYQTLADVQALINAISDVHVNTIVFDNASRLLTLTRSGGEPDLQVTIPGGGGGGSVDGVADALTFDRTTRTLTLGRSANLADLTVVIPGGSGGTSSTELLPYDTATTYASGQMAWYTESGFSGVVISRQDNNLGNTPALRARTAFWDILSGSDISQIAEFYAAEERLPDATNAWRLEAGTTAGVDGVIEPNPTARWYASIADIPENRQHLTKWRVLLHSKNYGQVVALETPSPVIDPEVVAQTRAEVETSFPVRPFDIRNFEDYAAYAFTRSIDGSSAVDLVDLSFFDASNTELEADITFESNELGRLDLNEIGARCSRLRTANNTVGRISVRVTGVYAQIEGTLTHTPTKMNVTGTGYLEIAHSQSHTHRAWSTLSPNDEPGVRMEGSVTLTEATTASTTTQGLIVVGRLEPAIGTTPTLAAGDPANSFGVNAQDAHGVQFRSTPYTYPTTGFDDDVNVDDLFILGYTQDDVGSGNAKWQFFGNNTVYETSTAATQATAPAIVSGSGADLWYIFWTDTLSDEAKNNFSTEIIKEPFGSGLYGAVDKKAEIFRSSTGGGSGTATALRVRSLGTRYTGSSVTIAGGGVGNPPTLSFVEPALSAWEYDSNTGVRTLLDPTAQLVFPAGQTLSGIMQFVNDGDTDGDITEWGLRLVKNRGLASESLHPILTLTTTFEVSANSNINETFNTNSVAATINFVEGDTLEFEIYFVTTHSDISSNGAVITSTEHGEQSGQPGGDPAELTYDTIEREWVLSDENGDEYPIFTNVGEPEGDNKAYIDGQDLIPTVFYLDVETPTNQYTTSNFTWNATDAQFDIPTGLLRTRPETVTHNLYFVIVFRTLSATPTAHSVLPTLPYTVGGGADGADGRQGLPAVAKTESFTFRTVGDTDSRGDLHSTNDSNSGVLIAYVAATDQDYWLGLEVGDIITLRHNHGNYLVARITMVDTQDSATGQMEYDYDVLQLVGYINGRSGDSIHLDSSKPERGEDGDDGDDGRQGLPAVAKSEAFTFTTPADTDTRGELHSTNDANSGVLNAFVATTDQDYWLGLEVGDIITIRHNEDNYLVGRITQVDTQDSSTGEIEYDYNVLQLVGYVNGRSGESIHLDSSKPERGPAGMGGGGSTVPGELAEFVAGMQLHKTYTTAFDSDPTTANGQARFSTIGGTNFISLRHGGLTSRELGMLMALPNDTLLNIATTDGTKRLNVRITQVTEAQNATIELLAYTEVAGSALGTFAAGDTLSFTFGGKGFTSLYRHFAFNVSNETELAGVPTTGHDGVIFVTIDQDFTTTEGAAYNRHDLLFWNGTDFARIYRVWLEYSENGHSAWQRHDRDNDEKYARFIINGQPTDPFLWEDAMSVFGSGRHTAITGTFSITGVGTTAWDDAATWALSPPRFFEESGNLVEFDGNELDLTATMVAAANEMTIVSAAGSPTYTLNNAEIWMERLPSATGLPTDRVTIAELEGSAITISPGSSNTIPFRIPTARDITFENITDGEFIRIRPTFVFATPPAAGHISVYADDLQFTITGEQRDIDAEVFVNDGMLKSRNPDHDLLDLDTGRAYAAKDLKGDNRTHTYTPELRFGVRQKWQDGRTFHNIGQYFTVNNNRLTWHGPSATVTIHQIASQDAEAPQVWGFNTGDADVTLTDLELRVRKFTSSTLPHTSQSTIAEKTAATIAITQGNITDVDLTIGARGATTIELEDGNQIEFVIHTAPVETGTFYFTGGNLKIDFSVTTSTEGVDVDVEQDGETAYLRYTDPLKPTDEEETRLIDLSAPRILIPTQPKRLVFYIAGQTERITSLGGSKALTIGQDIDRVKIPFNLTADELDYGATNDIVRHLNADDVSVYADAPIGTGNESGVLEFQAGEYDLFFQPTIDIRKNDAQAAFISLRRVRPDEVDVGNHEWNSCCYSVTDNLFLLQRYDTIPPRNQHWYRYRLQGGYDSAVEDAITNHNQSAICATPNRVWTLGEELGGNIGQIWARSWSLTGSRHSGEDENLDSNVTLQPRDAEYRDNTIVLLAANNTGDGHIHIFSDDFKVHQDSFTLPTGAAWDGVTIIDGLIWAKQGQTIRVFDFDGNEQTSRGFNLQAGTYVGLTYHPVSDDLLALENGSNKLQNWTDGSRITSDEVLDEYRYYHPAGDTVFLTLPLRIPSIKFTSTEQVYFESFEVAENINLFGYLVVEQIKA